MSRFGRLNNFPVQNHPNVSSKSMVLFWATRWKHSKSCIKISSWLTTTTTKTKIHGIYFYPVFQWNVEFSDYPFQNECIIIIKKICNSFLDDRIMTKKHSGSNVIKCNQARKQYNMTRAKCFSFHTLISSFIICCLHDIWFELWV